MSNLDVVPAVEAALREHFGQVPTRANVSFLGVEPIEVLRFEPMPGEWAYLSLGMSRRPMTGASETVVIAEGPRAELMLHVRDAGAEYTDAWRQLAVLAAAPVVEGIVYTTGMTVDLGQPIAKSSRCSGGVVAESALPSITAAAGCVDVLQVLPATSTELAWSRVHGSPALRERWSAHRVDLLDLGRRPVDLT